MKHTRLLSLILLAQPLTVVFAADLVVDESGAAGTYATIGHAMLAASPGDRILVRPGHYPAFQFSRGVDVIGLGPTPSDVVVDRVDYHVSLPPFDYTTSLSNLTLCGSGASNTIALSGNELARGTLLIDSVQACGGVYLHGAAAADGGAHDGFYVLAQNASFTPFAGAGFGDAAFDFLGDLDLVGTRIQGWSASLAEGQSSAVALRLHGSSSVRLSGSELIGGAGDIDATGALADGGDAIDSGGGTLPVTLTVGGQTLVRGGDAPSGVSGDGVDLVGLIEVGDAGVLGGVGATPGAAYAQSGPVALAWDPELVTSPARAFAASPPAVFGGAVVSFALDPSVTTPLAIAISLGVQPLGAYGSPLAAPLVFGTRTLAFRLPALAAGYTGVFGFAQGFLTDPATGAIVATNPVSLRIDF